MSKAFTKESDAEGDEHDHAAEEAAHAQPRRGQELHHTERRGNGAGSGHRGR
jgi:hypothetical protein